MIDTPHEFVVKLLLFSVFFFVLLPITVVLSTPLVLIGASFVPGPYVVNVNRAFRMVCRVWFD